MKLVKVKWLDHAAFHFTQWREEEAFEELTPVTVETVGWILRDAEDHIVLVATVANNGSFSGDFLILKNCILDMKEMEADHALARIASGAAQEK